MPKKVDPLRRDQNAGVSVTPNDDLDWIDRDQVAKLAKRHGIRDGYNLYAALDQTIIWYLMEASKENDAPTREQKRQAYRQFDEFSGGLETLLASTPFGLYEEITQNASDGSWKSRLLDNLRTFRDAIDPLHVDATKPAKRTPDRARQNFVRNLIRVYAEGTGQLAKAPHWNGMGGGYGGAILAFALDCIDLIPENEIGTNPRRSVSDTALADALRRQIRGGQTLP